MTAYESICALLNRVDRAVSMREMGDCNIKYITSYASQFVRSGRLIKLYPDGTVVPKELARKRVDGALFTTPDRLARDAKGADTKPSPTNILKDIDALLDKHDDSVVMFVPEAKPEPPPAPAPKLSSSLDELAMRFAEEFARVVAEQVQARLSDYIGQVLEQAVADVPTPARVEMPQPEPVVVVPPEVKTRKRKLRVCIASLLPAQQQIIRNEFGKDMDLVFLGHDTGPKQVRGKLEHADVAIVMTNFVGHWIDRLFAEANVENFQRVTGGMSKLRDVLTSIYCKT